MADPVGAIGPTVAATYALAVTRKEHDQKSLEGQEAVRLIQAATAPKLATTGPLGTKLNVIA